MRSMLGCCEMMSANAGWIVWKLALAANAPRARGRNDAAYLRAMLRSMPLDVSGTVEVLEGEQQL